MALLLIALLLPDRLQCTETYSDVRGKIELPSHASSSSSTADIRVTLFPFHRVAFVDPEGYFAFFDVPNGKYRMEIASENWKFQAHVVTIDSSAGVKVSEIDGKRLDPTSAPLSYFVVCPYAQVTPPENPIIATLFSFLRNPLILITLLGLGVGYLIPVLISEEDMRASMKEIREGIEKMQKHGVQSASG